MYFLLFLQEEELHYNVTAGIVLSDHSLVLQSITRDSAGKYTCMAVNVEGRASSNVVNLEIMCKYVSLLLPRDDHETRIRNFFSMVMRAPHSLRLAR